MSELSDFQKWCKEILPIVQAGADGEDIEYFNGSEWRKKTHYCMVNNKETYRIKPRTIKVNGFEITAPMSEAPKEGGKIYIVTLYSATGQSAADGFYSERSWCNSVNQNFWLKHGIVHSTKEAAIAHAKAMLGIDPNWGEE